MIKYCSVYRFRKCQQLQSKWKSRYVKIRMSGNSEVEMNAKNFFVTLDGSEEAGRLANWKFLGMNYEKSVRYVSCDNTSRSICYFEKSWWMENVMIYFEDFWYWGVHRWLTRMSFTEFVDCKRFSRIIWNAVEEASSWVTANVNKLRRLVNNFRGIFKDLKNFQSSVKDFIRY